MERFLCIHGHFYQPPRENPWLEAIELQDSAAPYHDWNERITAECYAPNATARILDGEGRISAIVSNYARISFNFGPTVLAWMKDKMPDIHEAIVTADKLSQERFSGHGSGLAQVYNHVIMPLANDRDKFTQVCWGIRDFESRFGRKPEGMWLAETAADIPTLSALAEQGIKFTILSPFQASRTRELGKRNWRDVNGGRIDPTRPYLIKLPSGRTMTLFFYDAPVSQAVAFEKLLSSGERFAHRLASAYNDSRQWDQLVHIATDGESYGHHHRHGEMALAYALQFIETNKLARLTNYGEYLESHPPTQEVQIHEKSAWSCSHGVGRWMADCGCNSGGHPGWNQSWRTPLREALDWLRDQIAPVFEQTAKELLQDPWAARNEYISVILDRSPESMEAFFGRQTVRPLDAAEQARVLRLMELQRHAMLMYTSCGWFFDEVSGLESVQVVQYAARAIQLARELFGQDFEAGFLERFEAARSNIPENCNGRCVYEKFAKPAMVDLQKATAHYAISSIFQQYAPRSRVYSFTFEDENRQVLSAGKTQLAVGRTRIISEITHESDVFFYAILYLGEHNLTGSVGQFESPEAFDAAFQELKAAYEAADFPQVIRLIDRQFGHASYSLKSLFKDEQRRILGEILASTREDLEGRFRLITERYTPLMRFLRSAGAPLPSALQSVSDYILHHDLRMQFEAAQADVERLRTLLEEAAGRNIFDADLSYGVARYLERVIQEVAANPEDLDRMRNLEKVAELIIPIPMGLNLWKVQNTYWEMLQTLLPKYRDRAAHGDEFAQQWMAAFVALGERLSFAVNHLQAAPADETNPKQLDDLKARARIPAATYRLQFNRDFTFQDARETAEYLRDLGITDAYASPIFRAGPESTHGYDVCSFDGLNPALGDRSDFTAFAGRLRELGLGLLLDMVPNHMGASLCNPWWADVLTHGRQSQFAEFFDIDWRPAGSGLFDKVLLPVLEAPYATVLEQGKLKLVGDEGGFAIAYHDHNLPLAPGSCALLLEQAAVALDSEAKDDSVAKDAHRFAAALKNGDASISALREQVDQWTKASPAFTRALEAACSSFNGQPGQPRSFDRLHALIREQPYRLAFWKVAAEEINYRRFFDVTQLVSLRMEEPEVFQAAHALLFELLESGEATGVRVDHPDGLRDPTHYFERLQAGLLRRRSGNAAEEEREHDRPGQSGDPSMSSAVPPAWPLYVVAEKILSGDEPLRPDWAVAGSTGYDFLNKVNGLFVDSRNQEPFDALYREFSANALFFRDAVHAGKKRILEGSLAGDLNALAHRLAHVTRQTRYGQDYTFRQLHRALAEVLCAFPVYRTYATETSRELIPLERHYTEQAIAEAKARNPGLDSALFDLIQDLLLLHTPADLDGPATELNRQFVLKFQQLSGPATAKGLEDTAFYNYNRLISLNEVGGDAGQFGTTASSFHQHNLRKAERWPHSLLATATHDTKRGEDTRARINVLSEMPVQWRDAINRWSRLNADKKTSIAGQPAPDPNDEYLLYQTLVGAWPASSASLRDPRHPRGTHDDAAVAALPQRIADYMIKALREAKARTNWTDPNEPYETAVREFATHVLDPHASSAFLVDFQSFQQTVSYFGQFNSLSQLLLKIASPGVPDFYQGTELWDFSLVDPDNRRAVDYSLRRRLLAVLVQEGPALLPELADRTHTGEIKLFLMHQALKFRRQNREVFEHGGYLPLEASGPRREHVCAFARIIGGRVVIAAAPRLVFGLMQGQARAPLGESAWQDTALDLGAGTLAGEYQDVLTGERISTLSRDGGPCLRMSAAFALLPVALLARVAE